MTNYHLMILKIYNITLLILTIVFVYISFLGSLIKNDIDSRPFVYEVNKNIKCDNEDNFLKFYIGYLNYCVKNPNTNFEKCFISGENFIEESNKFIKCDSTTNITFYTGENINGAAKTISIRIYDELVDKWFKNAQVYYVIFSVGTLFTIVSILLICLGFYQISCYLLGTIIMLNTAQIYSLFYIKNTLSQEEIKISHSSILLIITNFMFLFSITFTLIHNRNNQQKKISTIN